MGRSISVQVDEKHVDQEKLENFRQWIDSYQKWKSWQSKNQNNDEEDLQNDACSPFKSISTFLVADVDPFMLESSLKRENQRCNERTGALVCLRSILDTIHNTIFEKYALGINYFYFNYMRELFGGCFELKYEINLYFLIEYLLLHKKREILKLAAIN